MNDLRPNLLERLPLLTDRPILAYVFAALSAVLAGLLRSALNPYFPPGFPFLTFFPAVIISAFLWGRGPGVLSAILCGLIAWYFFIAPLFSFQIGAPTATALLFYIGVVAVDIALVDMMQKANARLREERERTRELAAQRLDLVERSDVLFNELQHRVSNNLMMVAALLSVQRRALTDAGARQILDNAVHRVQLIGRIQRQLYDVSGGQVALDRFVTDLVADLAEAGGKPGIACRVDAQADMVLDPNALIPLALILAEAVANAFEHGFADRETGQIDIRVKSADGLLNLSVTDNGVGLPTDFDITLPTSLGLTIATTLARQLGGTFDVQRGDAGGTITRLTMASATPRLAAR
ncbi:MULTISPECIES: sensor histidine kinase [Sphingomonas]|jgi:two-component sensor histidine kinase|uniref:histidine kinase n=1 Tax=Sphingomonas echinoides TaxID=59803 RepID=A0ABU4PQL9_9SPHN|nr:DUF4118 domain-containing protein [Sphingomonas echinoides]MDX5985437.1 DUF4118 domain-containing protein [Sphingomonas echinoides]